MMAEYVGKDLLTSLCPELLSMILSYLPAKSLLNLSETCRKLRNLCINFDKVWKGLCKVDFDIDLVVKGIFQSFHELYKLLWKYRVVLEESEYSTHSGYFLDWLYYWSALWSEPPLLAFTTLAAGRTKKTWALTNEDLTAHLVKMNDGKSAKLERYYSWTVGYSAALSKHGSVRKLQEATLKRCMRNVKKIGEQFPKAAVSRRTRVYRVFVNENSDVKAVLMKCNDTEESYLRQDKPQKIGDDFINGRLHRTGKKQLQAYVDFFKQLQEETEKELSNDVLDCVLNVYETMSSRVYETFVRSEEFLDCSKDYMERVHHVWVWQNMNGMDYRLLYRDCASVKAHPCYRPYVEKGDETDYRTLRLHFEGSEKLRLWLGENQWITTLLDINIIEVLEGGQGQSSCKDDQDVKLLQKFMKKYRKSGRYAHFKKIIKHLGKLSKAFLDRHYEYVQNLEDTYL